MRSYSFPPDDILKLQFQLHGSRFYDLFCFGIDAEGKFDPKCSVFKGQKRAIDGALTLFDESIEIILSHIPEEIRKLIFVVNPLKLRRGESRSNFSIQVSPVASKKSTFQLKESDIDPSQAIVIADLARTFSADRVNWRLQFFREEFNGLSQKSRMNLEKNSARAILVVDLSPDSDLDSIHRLAIRMIPELLKIDAESEIDYFAYASRAIRLEPINFSNFFINIPPRDSETLMLGTKNDPYVAMEMIVDEFKSISNPTLAVIITNGNFHDRKWVRNILIDSQQLPIFWNFFGIGGKSWITKIFGSNGYKHLKKFAELPNVNFAELDDFASMKDWEIRNCLRKKFLEWISRK